MFIYNGVIEMSAPNENGDCNYLSGFKITQLSVLFSICLDRVVLDGRAWVNECLIWTMSTNEICEYPAFVIRYR